MTKEELSDKIAMLKVKIHVIDQDTLRIRPIKRPLLLKSASELLDEIEEEFNQYIDILEPLMEHKNYPHIREDIRKMATLLQENLLSLPIQNHPYCCLMISRVINAACDFADKQKDICSQCGQEIEK